jgi:RES domain-containing protein
LYGGRWNSPGRAAVYASTTLSLAALEYLVHIDPADAPGDLHALTIEVPDTIATDTIDASHLRVGWERSVDSAECRAFGDGWLDRGSSAALLVPSAAIPSETNVLLNPRHPDFAQVRLEADKPFSFDPRLFE